MQFKAIIVAATLALGAAAESGFLAPRNAPDGIYSVYRDESGAEVHEAVDGSGFSAKFVRSAMKDSPLEARADIPNGVSSCDKNSAELNHADTDKANAMLDAQCGGWTKVKKGKHFYSISGGTVAYFCNMASQEYGCSTGPRIKYSAMVTASCGAYKPGWVTVEEANQGYGGQHYSYGYQASSAKFCGTGTGR